MKRLRSFMKNWPTAWRGIFRTVAGLVFLAGLGSGCAANIVESKLMSSKSIFLPPGSTKSIHVQSRNISENPEMTLSDIGGKLAAKGYTITTVHDQARFVLQTKVVYCNVAKPEVSFETVLTSGFGAGVGSTAASTGGMEQIMGMMGGMSGTQGMPNMAAMLSRLPQPPQQDETVMYFCAVDVQVTEQGRGRGTKKEQASPEERKPHQMRIVAGVRQKKLKLEEATPLLREKLMTGVAGMF